MKKRRLIISLLLLPILFTCYSCDSIIDKIKEKDDETLNEGSGSKSGNDSKKEVAYEVCQSDMKTLRDAGCFVFMTDYSSIGGDYVAEGIVYMISGANMQTDAGIAAYYFEKESFASSYFNLISIMSGDGEDEFYYHSQAVYFGDASLVNLMKDKYE